MSVRAPDKLSHRPLEPQLRQRVRLRFAVEQTVKDVTFGAYVDAMPEKWLVWHGHGPYGPPRYACAEHRGDLTAYLRNHYGAIGPHPWKKGPYPTKLEKSDRADRKVSLGAGSSMPSWRKNPSPE